MLQFPLGRDRIEFIPAILRSTDRLEAVMFQRDALHHGMHDRETAPSRRADSHQRGVFKFTDHARVNPILVEPGIERRAQSHVCGREQGGSAIQRLRKIPAQFGREWRDGAKRKAGIPEAVIKYLRLQSARSGLIREHDVESMSL